MGGDGGTDTGAVYIYSQEGGRGQWTEQQKLVITANVTAHPYFGSSLAIQGSIMAVGAYGDASNRGSVYVYTLMAAGTWTELAKLTASDGEDGIEFTYWEGAEFGFAVAISLETIVVGAYRDDHLDDRVGSTYVFQRQGEDGLWTQQAKLTPLDGQAFDRFGRTVAIEGDTICVGSARISHDKGESGAVYVFEDDGGTWTQQNKLLTDHGSYNDFFGHSVALQGGLLLVGAPDESNTSAVYLFAKTAGMWTEKGKLVSSVDFFGSAVAVDNGVLFVGATGGNRYAGSVYVFEWCASEIKPTIRSAIYISIGVGTVLLFFAVYFRMRSPIPDRGNHGPLPVHEGMRQNSEVYGNRVDTIDEIELVSSQQGQELMTPTDSSRQSTPTSPVSEAHTFDDGLSSAGTAFC